MKTTLDTSDPLLDQAREIARREGTTSRALVELGSRRVASQKTASQRFTLPDASFGGQGLHSGLANASWEAIRDLIYKDRET